MEGSEEEKSSDDGAHTEARGLFKDILEGEVRRPRLEYFDQIIGNMRCETFRDVKELAWDISEWKLVVVSNQS